MERVHWSEAYPHLLKEWHPSKNVGITPTNCRQCDKVWWYLPYDDPETGKHFVFEWMSSIGHRIRGSGCPFLAGKAVWPGYNDLASKHSDLAAQWHPIKNGELMPDVVMCHSHKKVWWYLPYDDPETGKHFDFEWEANIDNRVSGDGCPYLSGHVVWPGYNDLATKRPDLAVQWHPTKNGELLPEIVTCHSHKKVWWYLPYDDPETGKHFDFEWEANIDNRVSGDGCPYLSGHVVWPGYNDLATKRPDLAVQWHPIKNGELLPEIVTCHSHKKVWWYLPYDDPETGKHFDFEWWECIDKRAYGRGCPYLSGHAVWPGYNDLASKYSDLTAQWHPTKNCGLTPEMITCYSNKKVWWYLPYDDPETGKHFDFEWQECIENRVYGRGCPYLSGHAVWPGFNDLETCAKMIAEEWHHKKNKKKMPSQIYMYEHKTKRWWNCSTCGHEWRATVHARTIGGVTCPNCRRNKNYYS